MNTIFEKLPLFVYGTLMKNQDNYRILEHFSPPEPMAGKLAGYFMAFVTSKFPSIQVLAGGLLKSAVYGQVFDISTMPDEKYVRLIDRLDRLESEGYLYNRKVVSVSLGDGSYVQAYAYVWALESPSGPIIPWGFWGSWEFGHDPRALFERQVLQAAVPQWKIVSISRAPSSMNSRVNFWPYGEDADDSEFGDAEDVDQKLPF